MGSPSRRAVVDAVLERYPRTFAQELGLRSLETPSPLFRLLVMATLMSARISAAIALAAARALGQEGWNTAGRMADAGWEARTRVLNRSGYARYDERTSSMLGDSAALVLDRYGGDLRRLRDAAERDPGTERRLLKACKGMGDVGVDISFREVQRSWTELAPFADAKALGAARRLGLGTDAGALHRLAGERFVNLVDGLVRVALDGAYDEVRQAARA